MYLSDKPMVLYQQPGCPDVFLNGTTQQWCLPTPKLRCSDSVERVSPHFLEANCKTSAMWFGKLSRKLCWKLPKNVSPNLSHWQGAYIFWPWTRLVCKTSGERNRPWPGTWRRYRRPLRYWGVGNLHMLTLQCGRICSPGCCFAAQRGCQWSPSWGDLASHGFLKCIYIPHFRILHSKLWN